MDISKALFLAMQKYPYYSRGFMALTPVNKDISALGEKPILGVDKYWRIYWCKEALDRFKYEIEDVMRHELEHLLRDHAGRGSGKQHEIWNIAADAEINDDLESCPVDAIFPSTLDAPDGKSAEFYYTKAQKKCINCKSSEGSGVTGVQESWEVKAPDEGKGGDTVSGVEDAVQAEALRDQVAEAVKEQIRQDPGSVPNGVKLWAEARAKGKLPTISWKAVLNKTAQKIKKGRFDYSYQVTSRRQNRGDKIILPGVIAYKPTMYVVIDTSGSMKDQADWVAGVLRHVSAMSLTAVIVDCDAQVHGSRKLSCWKDVLKSKGGGGTDMRAGIEYAQNNSADMILVLTDGYTPWPEVWPKNAVGLIHRDSNSTKTEIKKGS